MWTLVRSVLETEVGWATEASVATWLRGLFAMLMFGLARHLVRAGRNLQRSGM